MVIYISFVRPGD